MLDSQTWRHCLSLLPHCSNLRHLQSIHSLFITNGLLVPSSTSAGSTTFALSRLILKSCSLAPSPTSLSYASLLFRHAPSPPNSFIFNTLIRAYCRSSQPRVSLSYFLLMLRSSVYSSLYPDHHTYAFVLSACIVIPSSPFGFQLHSVLVKNGLASADPFVQTALLRLYAQVEGGDITLACKMFDEIPHRDAVQFDVLMNGYLRLDAPERALHLFRCMLHTDVNPDAHVITTALVACSHAGALDQGVWIHTHLLGEEMRLKDSYIASALINMYAKCGSINKAIRVFEALPERNNTFTWSTMIGGFAMHGFAHDAMKCLNRMQEEGIRPDGIVILGVLAACAHAGLVKEGILLLSEMESRYCVTPQHEHYSCAVDLLCRVGLLEDAVELIRKMPMKPLASVWGSLLTGCRIYKNVELAEVAVGELQRLTSEGGDDEGVYVQLSNIYRDANMLEDARRVRKLIGSRGTKKVPACSSIEVDGAVSSFVAVDQVHPKRVEIGWMVEFLTEDSVRTSSRGLEDEEDEGIGCICLE